MQRLPRGEWIADAPSFDAIATAAVRPLDLEFVDRLLYHAFALSAWKAVPGARWSLRVNPSSGNLHPTEVYVLAGPIAGLAGLAGGAAVRHYNAFEHGLETRAELPAAAWHDLARALRGADGGAADVAGSHLVLLGLTSIPWRESWKYGERAYRYCQHDVGHAIGAATYAAACLGWRARLVASVGDADLAALLGLDAQHGIEAEHPDCLLALTPRDAPPCTGSFVLPRSVRDAVASTLAGVPAPLSPDHHDWPVIDAVADACRKPAGFHVEVDPGARAGPVAGAAGGPFPGPASAPRATTLIRGRRSAVAMDGSTTMPADRFFAMLSATLPAANPLACDALPWRPRVHLAVFVHRVDGVEPGLLFLDRGAFGRFGEFAWTPVAGAGMQQLARLHDGDCRQIARLTSCHQDIAADGCFAVAMIAESDAGIATHGPWFYRALHWEAGLVGQVLYLEAERAGLRATGIGCFFDDLIGDALLRDRPGSDVLYHFTVGGPVEDGRLQTLAAYHHLGPQVDPFAGAAGAGAAQAPRAPHG